MQPQDKIAQFQKLAHFYYIKNKEWKIHFVSNVDCLWKEKFLDYIDISITEHCY